MPVSVVCSIVAHLASLSTRDLHQGSSSGMVTSWRGDAVPPEDPGGAQAQSQTHSVLYNTSYSFD